MTRRFQALQPLFRIGFLCLVAALAVWASWAAWAASGRADKAGVLTPVALAQLQEIGTPGQHGNMLAIQPWLVPADYATTDSLTHKLDVYFSAAKQRDWLNPATIAVLPEYSGTWLVTTGEKLSTFTAPDVTSAMTTVALTHLPSFVYYLATAPDVEDKAKWALFTLKSENMARNYQAVFGGLAQHYGVHLVAGSIVLPEPSLKDGQLVVRPGGALYNVSALFGPDGRIVGPLVVKAFPIDEEKAFTSSGNPQDIPVFQTPAGKLAVLICADAWYPASYAAVRKLGAQIIAVPSYSSGDKAWSVKWGGYNGAPNPADIEKTDIGILTEAQAWNKYAMAGRAPTQGMPNGLNVFLRGSLWDLGSDGATISLQDGQAKTQDVVASAVLTNLWLH